MAASGLRETLQARLDGVREMAVPIAQTALAAGIAWLLAHDVIGHRRAFFAPIAAIIALGLAPGNRTRRVIEMTFGVALGIGVGDALIGGIGSGTWQIALVVFLAMLISVLLGGGPLLVSQAASSAVLVATLAPPSGGIYYTRWIDALVGGGVGLAVLVVAPGDPLGRVRADGRVLLSELAATLEAVASALETADVAAAREALARARALDPLSERWRQTLERSAETVRLAPAYWRARGRVVRYAQAAPQVELAARNVRVLARAAGRAVELDPGAPAGLHEAVRDLAEAVRCLEADLARGESGERTIEAATRAAGRATRVLETDASLSASHVVGQIRSTAADLLRAIGLDQATAADRIRRARDSL